MAKAKKRSSPRPKTARKPVKAAPKKRATTRPRKAIAKPVGKPVAKPAAKTVQPVAVVAPAPVRSRRAKTEAGGWEATGRTWGEASHLVRAMALHEAGNLVEARAAYEAAIAEEDGGTFPKLQLLQIFDAQGDVPATLALVDELKGRGKTGRVEVVLSPLISMCEARALIAQHDFVAAEAAAREGIELDKSNIDAWRLLAAAIAAQHRLDDALAAIEQVNALDPAWANGHFTRAIYLHRAGRTPEAVDAVARATELAPEDGDAWYNLACYRALLGHDREALYALATAIRRDPSNAATARTDGDFASLAAHPEFAKLTA